MNLHARDRLIPYSLTFAEQTTTSLFRLVQTNWTANRLDLSLITYAVRILAKCFSEVQNCKYEVNILRVRQIPTIHSFSVVIVVPVFAQLIRTSDWDQNSGVRLVFGLSEKTQQKTNPKSVVTQCLSVNWQDKTAWTVQFWVLGGRRALKAHLWHEETGNSRLSLLTPEAHGRPVSNDCICIYCHELDT